MQVSDKQYKSYEYAFKRLFSTDTINKLKRLAKDGDYNMPLAAFLKYVVDEIYDLKYNSKVSGQNAY